MQLVVSRRSPVQAMLGLTVGFALVLTGVPTAVWSASDDDLLDAVDKPAPTAEPPASAPEAPAYDLSGIDDLAAAPAEAAPTPDPAPSAPDAAAPAAEQAQLPAAEATAEQAQPVTDAPVATVPQAPVFAPPLAPDEPEVEDIAPPAAATATISAVGSEAPPPVASVPAVDLWAPAPGAVTSIGVAVMYFPLPPVPGAPGTIEREIDKAVRASVESPKHTLYEFPVRGIDIDEFVNVLAAAIRGGKPLAEWKSGRYDLEFNGQIIPGQAVRELLSAQYLYQPSARLTGVDGERRREFRDRKGRRHVYDAMTFESRLVVDLKVWKLDLTILKIERLLIPSVSHTIHVIQQLEKQPDGEYILLYTLDELERKAMFELVRDPELKRKLRFALRTQKPLTTPADVLASKRVMVNLDVTRQKGAVTDQYYRVVRRMPDGTLRDRSWLRIFDLADEGDAHPTRAWAVGAPLMPVKAGDTALAYDMRGLSLMPKVSMLPIGFVGIDDPEFGTIAPINTALAFGYDFWANIGALTGLPMSDYWVGQDLMLAPGSIFHTYWGVSVGKKVWLGRLGLMPTVGMLVNHARMEATEQETACEIDQNLEYDCMYRTGGVAPRVGGRWEVFLHPRVSLAGAVNYSFFRRYNYFKRETVSPRNIRSSEPYALTNTEYSPGGLQLDFGVLVSF